MSTVHEPLGLTFLAPPLAVEQLREPVVHESPAGPYTVVDFGGFSMRITSADHARRLHLIWQNAVIRQEMAEAKHQRGEAVTS